MDHIFRLHDMLTSFVMDHDPKFTNKFWHEHFELQGTQLNVSTTHHPQTNGKTEVVNKCLETFLRCFTLDTRY